MTEVPEHLLAKSREARARLTGEGADAGTSADAAGAAADTGDTTPVPAAAATPAPVADTTPAEPPPPEPVAPYGEAAKNRQKVPVWIVPVLLFIPIWAIYYVGLLEPPPAEEGGLLVEGAEVYAVTGGCAGCHGAAGGGGTGRQLNAGEVLLTFPVPSEENGNYDGLAHMISWVVNGTGGTQQLGLATYGDPNREGGARETGSFGNMGGNNSLTVEELLAVVHYERVNHGELSEEDAEAELALLEAVIEEAEATGFTWNGQSPEEISELLAAAGGGEGGSEAAAE